MPRGQGELREAISEYETLMQKFLPKLPSPKEQDDARHILARLKAANRALLTDTAQQTAKIPAVAQTSTGTGTGSASNASPTSPSCRQTLLQAERFLGEVSDVRFFNLVKQVIQNQLGSIDANQGVDSYEQDGDVLSPKTTVDRPNRLVKLPKAEQIASFTQVYFSTVHLAFPFIPQTLFMRSIREAETSLDDAPQHCTTLALICKWWYCWFDVSLVAALLMLPWLCVQMSFWPLEHTIQAYRDNTNSKTSHMKLITCKHCR